MSKYNIFIKLKPYLPAILLFVLSFAITIGLFIYIFKLN